MLRWRIAMLVSVAIAISYLDRVTLPSAIEDIKKQSGLFFSDQQFALLNTAFLAAYGAMYLIGGRLMDVLGTRVGFAIIMVFWSLACASHGFASGLALLVMSRLMLGLGEGGGFPAATRAVAEWFPVKERSSAMGIINAGTAAGGMIALPFVAVVITYVYWFDITSWRWIFFITGAMGILWTCWWLWEYYSPEKHPRLSQKERNYIQSGIPAVQTAEPKIPLATLFQHRETWGIVCAKFLTDAAWYFMLFWLPKYLMKEHHLDIKATGSIAWTPHAAAGVGCLLGGNFSSWLLRRQYSLNASRKLALFASAIVMPLLILVPYVSTPWVIVLFSIGYFGQQSWSTLVMVLPTDLFPKRAVGTVAGLVGLGGALGGIALGQLASYLFDHQYSYKPVMLIAGLLHVSAFVVILATVRSVRPLLFPSQPPRGREWALSTFELALKVQLPAILVMLLGLTVVNHVMQPLHFTAYVAAAAASFAVLLSILLMVHKRLGAPSWAIVSGVLAITGIAAKIYILFAPDKWGKDQAFASSCMALSGIADLILLVTAVIYAVYAFKTVDSEYKTEGIA